MYICKGVCTSKGICIQSYASIHITSTYNWDWLRREDGILNVLTLCQFLFKLSLVSLPLMSTTFNKDFQEMIFNVNEDVGNFYFHRLLMEIKLVKT